jgi:predicted DNA-binding transcriptional regulator AlpA
VETQLHRQAIYSPRSWTENLTCIFRRADWHFCPVLVVRIPDHFVLSESENAHHGGCQFTHVHGLGSKGISMADLPKVVSAKIAARFVGLSASTLAKLRLNGNGPLYCKLGRRVVYRLSDLEQWLQSRTARDTSDADTRFLKALTAAHPR